MIKEKWKWKSLGCGWLFETPWTIQNTGVGSLSLLQGIFSTQGSNLGLLHCKQALYYLSHQESACGKPRFSPWVGRISWRWEWLRPSVFLPGEFHRQRRLMETHDSPWSRKGSDMTERLTLSHTWQAHSVLSCEKLKAFSLLLGARHNVLFHCFFST